MSEASPLYLLMEQKLGESLAEFIASRRPATAWRHIATEITARTGIDVTYETVRVWGLSTPQAGSHPTPTHPVGDAGTGPRAPYPPSAPRTPTPPQPNPPPPQPKPPTRAIEESGEAAA